jgi:UDP-glucose 4-epimerase
LIEAHVLTLRQLNETNGEYLYNVGTGKGTSNKAVIEMVKKVSNVDFPVIIQPRRSGDVAETVADATKINEELNFQPKYSDLETIIKTAWKWHERNEK